MVDQFESIDDEGRTQPQMQTRSDPGSGVEPAAEPHSSARTTASPELTRSHTTGSGDTRLHKSNNPFLNIQHAATESWTGNSAEVPPLTPESAVNDVPDVWQQPQQHPNEGLQGVVGGTEIQGPPIDFSQYPFKTLNRILDDVRWTVPYKTKYGTGILNQKAFDYSTNLSKLAQSNLYDYDVLTLNNLLAYSPTHEEILIEEKAHVLKVIRGLIFNKDKHVYHVRLLVLENVSHQTPQIDKHEYHVIPHTVLSSSELESLRYCSHESGFYDDAFFKSSNSPLNHTLRVTIFDREFDDLAPIIDGEIIKQRYIEGTKKHASLSADTIPTPVHCIKTMIKVLKGPILMPATDSIKTISLVNTALDAQVDIEYLLSHLSFSLNTEKTDLIPPNLTEAPELKEAYIRKVQELVFLARLYGQKDQANEYLTSYSYSDNFSLFFTKIPEYDKHTSLVYFKTHNANSLPFLINLNICSYFPDELILKCFENTIKSDLANKLRYVDSLKNTINFRNGSSTNNKLSKYFKNLTVQGDLVGWHDYEEAIKLLGLPVADINSIDDDVVIAMYKASFKNDVKNYSYFNRQLVTIAKARSSQKLYSFLENEILPQEMALEELGVEEITEDELVITAYEFGLDDTLQSNGFNKDANKVVLLNKALLSVAVHRKSYLLLNYLETKLPDLIQVSSDLTLAKSYELLGAASTTSDFELITNFQNRLITSEDVRNLRSGLKAIAENKKSNIIMSFLKTGRIEPSLLPAENWPAGLDNIGNTCYLNSLLQYYFCIKPLRELILTFSENDLDLLQERKIGGRKVEQAEIVRSKQFIYHLRHLFDEMIHSHKRCVQPSKELAYLSFLHLSQPVSFKTASEDLIVISDNSDIEMADEVINVDDEPIVIHTEEITPVSNESEGKDPKLLPISTDQMESTIEVGRQQDVTECIENVTYQIETALVPDKLEEDGEQVDLIKKLFYGKIKQTITPIDTSGKPRVSVERFFSLIINVSDHPKNIYDSLDNYFSEDLVRLDEGLVKKSLTISEMPEVLQFHVQRVMFDREKLVAYKSIEPIPFSEKIYLDRYLDTTDEEILSKRSEVFKWKSEIQHLVEKKERILHVDETTHLNIIDSLTTTQRFLTSKVAGDSDLSIGADTLLRIGSQIESLKQELKTIETELTELREKVSNQFTSYTKVGYSIFAIFIHRGEASYGHYWVYIKDPHRNVFRKYNDEIVTEVPVSEVFNFNDGNTATPYYIVYVKDTLEHDYVEPLKREIKAIEV